MKMADRSETTRLRPEGLTFMISGKLGDYIFWNTKRPVVGLSAEVRESANLFVTIAVATREAGADRNLVDWLVVSDKVMSIELYGRRWVFASHVKQMVKQYQASEALKRERRQYWKSVKDRSRRKQRSASA